MANWIQPEFKSGDRVAVDGSYDIKGVVTAVTIRSNHTSYEVSWFANGVMQTNWIDSFRLLKLKEAEYDRPL